MFNYYCKSMCNEQTTKYFLVDIYIDNSNQLWTDTWSIEKEKKWKNALYHFMIISSMHVWFNDVTELHALESVRAGDSLNRHIQHSSVFNILDYQINQEVVFVIVI